MSVPGAVLIQEKRDSNYYNNPIVCSRDCCDDGRIPCGGDDDSQDTTGWNRNKC